MDSSMKLSMAQALSPSSKPPMKHKPNQNADADDAARREKRSGRKSSDGNKVETGIEEERKE